MGKALSEAVASPGFYYSFAYSVAIVLFGMQANPATEDALRHAPDAGADGVPDDPAVLIALYRSAVDGQRGHIRSRDIETVGDNLFPEHSWWRSFGFVLAWPLFVWNFFNWKPLSLVAGDRLHPDLRAHSADRPSLGQGRLLRLDLLLRRAGRDHGRHAAPEDAARPRLESPEHGRPGDPGLLLSALRRAHRHLDGARIVAGAAPRALVRHALLQPLVLRLLPRGRYVPRRHRRRRLLLLVLGARLVPLRLPAGGADAHLRALLAVPHLRR